MPILSRRLALRELAAEDVAALEHMTADARVLEHLPAQSRALAVAQRLAARGRPRASRHRRAYELAVVLRRGGRVIGACDLALSGPRRADFGYMLAPRHWGFGYGTEIAVALVDFAFGELGLNELSAAVAVENDRSRRVLDKAGLRWDGLMRRHARFAGRWWDCHRYVIDRASWQAARAPCVARGAGRS